MPDITIPDAAVEAAARAAYEEGFLRHVRRTRFGFTWDEISDEARESWRQVVIAAAPYIAAQERRRVADEIDLPADMAHLLRGSRDDLILADRINVAVGASRVRQIEADRG